MSRSHQATPGSPSQAHVDLSRMMKRGRSWSGRERHCVYLNLGNKREGGVSRFANLSVVSGIDFPEDGRALCLTDWDHDGDLDLWYRDRTAPRLRLMLNQHAGTRKGDFVSVLLQGGECNRNAIGAVVELIDAPGSGKLRSVRSVRAGDLFLSQSSRWLHFGLGENGEAAKARVIWPGGREELFQGLKAGGSFLLKEGSGSAIPVERTPRIIAAAADSSLPRSRDATAHINPPVALRLPPLRFRNPRGERGVPVFGRRGGCARGRSGHRRHPRHGFSGVSRWRRALGRSDRSKARRRASPGVEHEIRRHLQPVPISRRLRGAGTNARGGSPEGPGQIQALQLWCTQIVH